MIRPLSRLGQGAILDSWEENIMNDLNDVLILDATLRDGGLVNDHHFEDGFVREIYRANAAAGVDYMEFGYRADKKQFSPEKYGKWKFTSDEDIRATVGDFDVGGKAPKISIMVDVGRCDYLNDIHPKAESPVDLIRVATYIDTMQEAMEMVEYVHRQGYEVTCNLMAVSNYTLPQIKEAVHMMAQSPVIGAYVVDSYGSLYPEQVRELVHLFGEQLISAGKMVGIHAHNNQQCAFANTIEALNAGARMLDGSAYGMGRGAGNCHLEALLGYFNGERYHLEPALDLVENEMIPLKDHGVKWGYNTSYFLTGLTNQHPRTAIAATKDRNIDFREQYDHLPHEKTAVKCL